MTSRDAFKDAFGESDDDDDDDFAEPFSEKAQKSQVSRPTMLKEGAEPIEPAEVIGSNGVDDDDDDAFQDDPAPRQPAQLAEYSDEDDDEGIIKEVYERPVGPPAELKGALLPLPPINKLRLLQLSKFLGLQPLPLTAKNLQTERVDFEMDEKGDILRYHYKKQLTIRWRERQLPSGEVKAESNARFVTWSDGSRQLLLGDEVLDIGELDNTSANQFLFVRHTGPVHFIQGQGQLTKKMQLRPASLSSKFHKQLTADAQKKHVRVSKVKATATVADPNRAKADREKAEEDRIKSKENLQRRQEKNMKKFPTNGPRMNQSAGMTANFLEATGDGQDYEDDEELVATERGRSSLQRRGLAAEEQREAEERLARAKQAEQWEAAPAKKRPRPEPAVKRNADAQKALLEDSDEEEAEYEDEDEEEDEDEDDTKKRKPAKKARRGLVLSDDEDE